MVNLGPTEPVTPYVPRPGDIGLVRMPGRVGRAIRRGQWLNGDGYHDYEHAFGVVGESPLLPEGTGQYIIEAMPGGALLSPLSRYDGYDPVYIHCPEENREAVTAAYRALKGVPYSFADYFAIAAHRFHIPAPHLKRYIESSGHLICSQLVDHAAATGGWHLFDDGRWEGDVTPGDLYSVYLAQQLTG